MSLNLSDILNKILNESVSNDAVNDVINNRNYVEITYSDEFDRAPGRRLIQPYAYGMSKAGNPVLRAYQVSGGSFRGVPEWKFFRLDRITSWKPSKKQFNTPPPMQGYNAEDYNHNGDGSMTMVYNQVQFNDLSDTLNVERSKTQDIKNAPKISTKNASGPIPYASQQRKKNVFTSQPNSKKYDMYRKNIEDTENDFNRFDNDIWAKAEAEKEQQNRQMVQQSVPAPKTNDKGPIKDNELEKQKI